MYGQIQTCEFNGNRILLNMTRFGPEGDHGDNGSGHRHAFEEALDSHMAYIIKTYANGPSSEGAKADARVYAMLQVLLAEVDDISIRLDIEPKPEDVVERWRKAMATSDQGDWGPMKEEIGNVGDVIAEDGDEVTAEAFQNLARSLG